MCIVEGFPWTLRWLPNKRVIRGSLPILPNPRLRSQPQDGWSIIRQRSLAILCRNGEAGGTHQSTHRYHQCSEVQRVACWCSGNHWVEHSPISSTGIRGVAILTRSPIPTSNLFTEGYSQQGVNVQRKRKQNAFIYPLVEVASQAVLWILSLLSLKNSSRYHIFISFIYSTWCSSRNSSSSPTRIHGQVKTHQHINKAFHQIMWDIFKLYYQEKKERPTFFSKIIPCKSTMWSLMWKDFISLIELFVMLILIEERQRDIWMKGKGVEQHLNWKIERCCGMWVWLLVINRHRTVREKLSVMQFGETIWK